MDAEATGERVFSASTPAETPGAATERRARRRHVRDAARAARIRSRSLREATGRARDAALAARWRLWSAGVVHDAPSFVPDSWARSPDVGAAVADAARECEVLAFRVGPSIPLVTALCRVTVQHLRALDDGAGIALSLTARMLDRAERDLGGGDVETVLVAAGCRRCAAACRRALVALYLGDAV